MQIKSHYFFLFNFLSLVLPSCKRLSTAETTSTNATPLSTGQKSPLLHLLTLNTSASRKTAAQQLRMQHSELIKSGLESHKPLKEMVLQTILALEKNGDKLCPESAKIDVFRGHGYGLVPETKKQQKFIVSNYLTMGLPRFTGTDWEQQAQNKYANLNLNMDSGLSRFANSTDLKCSNGSAQNAIDKNSYSALSERHTKGCDNSVFISTTIDPEVARGYRLPVVQARICPGRIYPTSLQAFATEVEFLVYGFILPEELVKVHHHEFTTRYRLNIQNKIGIKATDKAAYAMKLPGILQPQINGCNISSIANEPNPKVSSWIGKRYNELTNSFADALEKQRNLRGGDLSQWIPSFAQKCSCDAYAKTASQPGEIPRERGSLVCDEE